MLARCLLTTLTPGLNPTLAPSRVPDAPDCWPLVRQVAMEVHREHLDEALQVLRREAGFQEILVEEDALLAGSGIYSVFCRR